jgi:iron complex transport system ATP-binding protein
MVIGMDQQAGLKINDLDVYYGTRQILNGINLAVKPGEVLAVIGPNGSGKSTMVRVCSGILTPKNGNVLVGNVNVHTLPAERRAKLISVVPQAVKLPDAFSAFDTVLMGRTAYVGWLGNENEQDHQASISAMERTNTFALLDRYIGELSGGEQQRVLIARALAQSAPVMLMDEPTAHLDLKHQSSIMSLIQSLAHHDRLAVLIVIHDLNLASLYADRVALLVSGKIMACGTPAEVLNAETLSNAYGVPVNVMAHPIYNTPLVLPDGLEN